MKKIYFLTVVAALALTACDNDNSGDTPADVSSTKLRISASINETYLSRAEGKAWGENDHIGIITTVGELAPDSFHPYVNLDYVTENGGEEATFSGPEMLFYNHLTISGYYPYRGSEGTAPGDAGGFLIKAHTRIDKQFEGNNKAIDFLHATRTDIKLAEAKEVQLAFSHMMTKLTFTFLSNTTGINKVDVAKLVKYQVEGLVMDGSFNTLTGECVADPTKDPENLTIGGLYIKPEDRKEEEAKREMSSLIVFPQTPKDQVEVRLRIFLNEAETETEDDDQVYFCTIKFGGNKLKPGYHYKFNVDITKAGLQLGTITIADWGEGVNSTIIATIDGEDPWFDPNEEN